MLVRGLNLERSDLKRVLSITLPAMLELVLSQLFGMADTIMLGQTGKVAIAAVGLTNNPTNLLIGVMSAFNVGVSASVAWALGAGDELSARKTVRNALILNLFMGIVATCIGFIFAGPIVNYMGADAETYRFAYDYMATVALGFLPAAICMGVTASLRGAGLTRVPMMYNIIANLLNVIGNYILIYGKLGFPELGVLGAAISTTFSRYAALVMALGFLFKSDTRLKLNIHDNFRPKWAQIKDILQVGLPGGIEQTFMQVGFMTFARSVAKLGTAVFAAHNIGLSINGLAWVPPMAFGVAATTLVGHSLGAGESEKAKDFTRFIHRCSLCGAGVIFLLFMFFAYPIARIYTPDLEVVALSAGVLRLVAMGLPGIATQQPIAAALRGARDSLFPLLASLIGIWVFRVLVAPWLMFDMALGLNGAWLSIVLDQVTRGVVVYWRFLTGKWVHASTKKSFWTGNGFGK